MITIDHPSKGWKGHSLEVSQNRAQEISAEMSRLLDQQDNSLETGINPVDMKGEDATGYSARHVRLGELYKELSDLT